MRRPERLAAASILSVVAASWPASPADKPATIEDLRWMAGVWTGDEAGVQAEEHWIPPKGGAMLGLHRDVAGGRMVSFEFLRIDETPSGIVYTASPKGRPGTPFRLVELAGRRVVFENREHDFPQRILYWTEDDGLLRARVEGTQNGKPAHEEWRWKRADPR